MAFGLDGLPLSSPEGQIGCMRNRKLEKKEMKADIDQKVTDKIIADLEMGELSWLKPWNAGNLEGRITKPLRHNGMPYNGINVLMLWGASVEAGYLFPYWMTFRQAKELDAHVRKGERGKWH